MNRRLQITFPNNKHGNQCFAYLQDYFASNDGRRGGASAEIARLMYLGLVSEGKDNNIIDTKKHNSTPPQHHIKITKKNVMQDNPVKQPIPKVTTVQKTEPVVVDNAGDDDLLNRMILDLKNDQN